MVCKPGHATSHLYVNANQVAITKVINLAITIRTGSGTLEEPDKSTDFFEKGYAKTNTMKNVNTTAPEL